MGQDIFCCDECKWTLETPRNYFQFCATCDSTVCESCLAYNALDFEQDETWVCHFCARGDISAALSRRIARLEKEIARERENMASLEDSRIIQVLNLIEMECPDKALLSHLLSAITEEHIQRASKEKWFDPESACKLRDYMQKAA